MENRNKEKNPNINRAAYITILTVLAIMAVLVVVTSSANRARRERNSDVSLPLTTTAPGTTPPLTNRDHGKQPVTVPPDTTIAPETSVAAPTDTAAPVTTAAPIRTDEPSSVTPVEESLPELLLPVSGNLLAAHDLETLVYSTTMNDYRVHCGLDIAAQPGAAVVAAAAGTVSQIWEDPMMGQCLSIRHTGGGMTIYRNLASVIPAGIAEGVEVRAGQLIGNIGETAMIEIAEEPHLHFEMLVNDDYVNPLDYLSASVKTMLALDEAYEG